MMIMHSSTILAVIKIFLFVSLFFVWVVRYENIKKEFTLYGLPAWLRDLVGILKVSFSIMILFNDNYLSTIGCLGILGLMAGAIMTHLRIKNPFQKMIPALSLSIMLILLLYLS